ncbi:phage tail assembly chaperone [Pseudovibrio sp. Ad5]|uniref:phage tail assembly chaperone n=1 Tax=Pseudovibrio sp. Ad5 TaxID=989436 RepID=UPI000AD26D81|nr:phage tail assembly chaperone [Pseudovibrio sp. Ad5]
MPVLGWAPDVFWKASIRELFAAIEGYNKAHGLGDDDNAITEDDHVELRRLVEQYG